MDDGCRAQRGHPLGRSGPSRRTVGFCRTTATVVHLMSPDRRELADYCGRQRGLPSGIEALNFAVAKCPEAAALPQKARRARGHRSHHYGWQCTHHSGCPIAPVRAREFLD